MKSPDTYNQINILSNLKNISDLYNKIKSDELNNKNRSFNLVIFDISLNKNKVDHNKKIILLEKLIKTIEKNRDLEVELYYYNDSNLILFTQDNINVFIKNIIQKLNNTQIVINKKKYKIKINYGRVNYPEQAKNYNQIITKLIDDLEQNKEEFKFPTPPNAIKINYKGDYIDAIKKDSTQYYLIAKNDKIEIIKQDILADRSLQISAGEVDNFELFYIIEGEVSYNDDKILYPGDSITVTSGDKEIYLKTITDTTFLYITSSPIFVSYQKRISKLLELNNAVAKIDVETEEHCDRLQTLSRITGVELGLDEKKLYNLGFASFLHDVGKSNVPVEILQKPGKLNKKEWEIMKKHTIWGMELIFEYFNDNHFNEIGSIINQHHERYDGSGYPSGLKEDEILIEAQILSVVDAYDAMTNDRPYQKGISKKKALKEIQSQKGKQFSPKVVDAFIKAIEKYDNK